MPNSHLKLSANQRGTIINLNGQIIPIDEAKVSVFDRSFLFGDSVYEVIRTYHAQPFRLKEHLVRLEKSAKICQMKLSQTSQEYEREVIRSIQTYQAQPGRQKEDVYVRLIVSRGAGKIGFGLKNLETPTLYSIIVEPISMFPNKSFQEGTRLQISDRMRNPPLALDPAMKSGNYLNSLLAFLTAAEASFDDAVLLDSQGFVSEGTTFNIFYVNRGIVATPPNDVGILDGITRRLIIDVCIKLGIPCREVRFPKEYLYTADEVFISGSVKEIIPVTQLDQKKIGNGKPGPITTRLKQAFDAQIESEMIGSTNVAHRV